MIWPIFHIHTMGATYDAGTAYPSGEDDFTPDFSGIGVAQSLVFCVVFCRSSLSIVLYVLRFTASDYHFSIFKLFFNKIHHFT